MSTSSFWSYYKTKTTNLKSIIILGSQKTSIKIRNRKSQNGRHLGHQLAPLKTTPALVLIPVPAVNAAPPGPRARNPSRTAKLKQQPHCTDRTSIFPLGFHPRIRHPPSGRSLNFISADTSQYQTRSVFLDSQQETRASIISTTTWHRLCTDTMKINTPISDDEYEDGPIDTRSASPA